MLKRALPLLLLAPLGCDPAPPAVGRHAAALRPDSPNNRELHRYGPNDVVESVVSPGGGFRIWFTRQGAHAVPGADVEGTPPSVLLVATRYDEVARFYTDELGFRPPIADDIVTPTNGGDALFDVYLLDFDGVGDGRYDREACLADHPEQCAGYMAQENDFAGYGYPSFDYAVRILASHEYFHAVQAAYDVNQGAVLAEATAVWATERYDPSLSDFEHFIDGYLDNPDRPLNEPLPGPVDAFSYGAGLVFQFLSERHGDGIIPALWEACINGANGVADPEWIDALDALLRDAYDSSLAEALVELAQWNLYTGPYADPALSYARGADYPALKMDNVTLPHRDARERFFRMSSHYYRANVGGRSALTAALVGDADTLDGLRLFMAGRAGRSQLPPVELPLDGSEALEVGDDWTTVVTWVTNTRMTGESRRPGLCVGAPDEVAACVAGLGGAAPVPDAGPVDGGVSDSGPSPEADAGPPAGDDAGAPATADGADGAEDAGGCQATPSPAPLWAALCLLLGWRRRRE